MLRHAGKNAVVSIEMVRSAVTGVNLSDSVAMLCKLITPHIVLTTKLFSFNFCRSSEFSAREFLFPREYKHLHRDMRRLSLRHFCFLGLDARLPRPELKRPIMRHRLLSVSLIHCRLKRVTTSGVCPRRTERGST